MTAAPSNTVFILGGARSGKSRFAEGLVTATSLDRHYLATGRAWDEEMQARIAQHKADRGPSWTTHEEPLDLVGKLTAIDGEGRIVLIDCLTLWVTNLMIEERDMAAEFAALADFLPAAQARLVSFPTRSVSASCRIIVWRGIFAIMPAGCTNRSRRGPP